MSEKPLTVGTKIRSAPDSSDVVYMKKVWRGRIVEVYTGVENAPDGCCYVTVGHWDDVPEPRTFATKRQLWRRDIVVDEEAA